MTATMLWLKSMILMLWLNSMILLGVSIGGMRAPHYTITLPKRFELDAFDLEFMECQDVNNGNVGSYEDITLADGLRKEGNTVDYLDEDHHEENISFSEAYSSACTPVRDVFSPHPVDEQLVVKPTHNMSNSVASMDIFCGTEFFLEDRLDPLLIGEAENEWGHDSLSGKEQMEYPMTKWNSQEEEPLNLSRSFYENEASILDSRRCQRIEECSTSIAFDVPSDSKNPGGAATPQIMAIHTPAPKERVKVLKKRKCSFDRTIFYESARLFYEALILKTKKCIDVRQENPYDDISLLETPVLRQLFEPEVVALL